MKCLHICNDLLGSKVHKNLYNHLERPELDQSIYYASRNTLSKKQHDYIKNIKGTITISKPIKKFHRLLFKSKIAYLYKDLKSKVDLSKFDIIHASTMFSDGALALKIYQDFNIPYILAIRGTDVNIFLKYRKDLRTLTREILANASKLVFISHALEFNFFQNGYINSIKGALKKKSQIIPNGLDPYWLEHRQNQKELTPNKILYIGKFNKNKNVLKLIHAFLMLKKTHPLLELHLVGGGGKQEKSIANLANLHPEIRIHGPIYDMDKLRSMIASCHIFAMVSIGETFGLVYVEALTQGLPIIFTKNQGIDGTFKENIGESVNPKSIISISEGINTLITNYSKYEVNKLDFNSFSWNLISNSYFKLYNSILIN